MRLTGRIEERIEKGKRTWVRVYDDYGLVRLALAKLAGKRFEEDVIEEGQQRHTPQQMRFWRGPVLEEIDRILKAQGRVVPLRRIHQLWIRTHLQRFSLAGASFREMQFLLDEAQDWITRNGGRMPDPSLHHERTDGRDVALEVLDRPDVEGADHDMPESLE